MNSCVRTVLLFALSFALGSRLGSEELLSGIYVAPHDLAIGTEPQGEHLVPVTLGQPAVGTLRTDPVFNTEIRRLPENHSHVYSQLQSFSHDNKYVILIDHDKGYHVRRYSDLSVVANSMGWHSAYRWIPNTHKIIALEKNPVRFRMFDCDTRVWSTLLELPQYLDLSGSKSYEELSRDGEWTAVYITDSGNGNQHIISVNLKEKRVGFERSLVDMGATDQSGKLLSPDWVGVSPLGNYVVVQWVRDNTIPASGLELYDIETGAFVRRIYTHHHHSDLGVSNDGKEYVVTSELSSPTNRNYPGIVVHWLDGSDAVHLRPMPWARMGHFSCQGPDGVILISAGGSFDGAYKNELYAAYFDGSVRRLVHHRSTSSEYWVQPKASISRDGSKVIWSSNWGVSGARGVYSLENLSLVVPVVDPKREP